MDRVYRMARNSGQGLGQLYTKAGPSFVFPLLIVALFTWFAYDIVSTYHNGGHFVLEGADIELSPFVMYAMAIGGLLLAAFFVVTAIRQKPVSVCEYGISIGKRDFFYMDMDSLQLEVGGLVILTIWPKRGDRTRVKLLNLRKNKKAIFEEAVHFVNEGNGRESLVPAHQNQKGN